MRLLDLDRWKFIVSCEKHSSTDLLYEITVLIRVISYLWILHLDAQVPSIHCVFVKKLHRLLCCLRADWLVVAS